MKKSVKRTAATEQMTFQSMDVVTIQMVRERQFLYNGNRVTQAEQAAEAFCSLMGNPDQECCVAMMLDGKNRISSVHLISQGSLNQSIVHPREVYKAAVLANAAARELLGVRLLDHVIVDTNSGNCASFANQGLMIAFIRLIDLLADEKDIPILAPVIQEGIIYRLLGRSG